MAHRRQGYRFENDWTKEELEEVLEIVDLGITLPVNIEIKARQTVLNLDKVKKYLTNARRISLKNCTCREARRHCDHSLETCMALNGLAEHNISEGLAREVTVEEALKVLEGAHEEGLVHMAYILDNEFNPSKEVNSICCCCSCCCNMLSATMRFGLAPHVLVSDTVSVTDPSKCNQCGVCASRCQFGAREFKDGSMVFKSELCFGCGLCVSKCPTKAITLMDK